MSSKDNTVDILTNYTAVVKTIKRDYFEYERHWINEPNYNSLSYRLFKRND
jgi:hypothetical protein